MKTIALIGAGKMGSALLSGLIQSGYDTHHIWVSSPNARNNIHLKKFSAHVTENNNEAVAQADVVVFAVKPFIMQAVCEALQETLAKKEVLLTSVVTGVTTTTIAKWAGKKDIPIVRTMPNVAAAVGAGATGLFANAFVSHDQKMFAESLFRSVGTTMWVEDESQLDAITAISGSGPAYFFYLCEAMQAASIALGLDQHQSKLLIAETALGAAKMMIESGDDFHVLRAMVTSQKGTTMAATDVLDQAKTKDIIKAAIKAAFLRAKELAS